MLPNRGANRGLAALNLVPEGLPEIWVIVQVLLDRRLTRITLKDLKLLKHMISIAVPLRPTRLTPVDSPVSPPIGRSGWHIVIAVIQRCSKLDSEFFPHPMLFRQ